MKAPASISDGVALPLFGRDTGRHAMRNSDANLLVDVLNALLALEVITTDDGPSRLMVTKGRAALILNRGEVSGVDDPASVSSVKSALVVSLAGDYLVCNLWDEDAEDWEATTVNVAKPPSLRNSVVSEGGFAYSYPDTNTRTATAAGYDAITYSVDRPYAAGNILKVSSAGSHEEVSGATYFDLNRDARAWIAIPVIPIP